jgi:hypothetical protein
MASRDAFAMADDRFELRIAQESSAIRQEIAALRAEVATRTELEAVRQDVSAALQEIGALRGNVATRSELDALRHEMSAGFARLERQISESRVDIVKWSFLFWTGQCFVIIGFLLVFLRNR